MRLPNLEWLEILRVLHTGVTKFSYYRGVRFNEPPRPTGGTATLLHVQLYAVLWYVLLK